MGLFFLVGLVTNLQFAKFLVLSSASLVGFSVLFKRGESIWPRILFRQSCDTGEPFRNRVSGIFNLLFVSHNEFAGEEATRLENSFSGK